MSWSAVTKGHDLLWRHRQRRHKKYLLWRLMLSHKVQSTRHRMFSRNDHFQKKSCCDGLFVTGLKSHVCVHRLCDDWFVSRFMHCLHTNRDDCWVSQICHGIKPPWFSDNKHIHSSFITVHHYSHITDLYIASQPNHSSQYITHNLHITASKHPLIVITIPSATK
jgi:hypothetical protein